MGHLRLGTLPRTKKWKAAVELLGAGSSVEEIAEAAAEASARDLGKAQEDATFQYVTQLLAELPLRARGPGFESYIRELGLAADSTTSVAGLLAGIDRAVDRRELRTGRTSDIGAMAKAALLEALSERMRGRLPSLFDPTATEVRRALASFSGGSEFAGLARDFFARLTYRSLDYYLSRELANHVGEGRRFASDADRTQFQRALSEHVFEASRIVEDFAGGWYGKTVWQRGALDQETINGFVSYAFKKLTSELARRRERA